MTATDQLRAALRDLEAKARELELDKKLESLADQADHYLREAAVKAGDYAHDNRGRVEETLDKAGAKVDEKTDGKYSRYVEKLRTGVLVGVDWVAQQRESTSTPQWATGTRWGQEPDAGAGPQDDVPPTASSGSAPAEPGATTGAPAAAPADSGDAATPADAPPAGSADSDAWVDVTDPPPAQGPTDPK
jgi:ElaB/YqjD/DUF883 family membrane-anchored ribosome-binding protein